MILAKGSKLAFVPGDPEFIPGPIIGGDEECGAVAPDGGPTYACTLKAGHRGDHAAHGSEHQMYARWGQEEA